MKLAKKTEKKPVVKINSDLRSRRQGGKNNCGVIIGSMPDERVKRKNLNSLLCRGRSRFSQVIKKFHSESSKLIEQELLDRCLSG